MSVEAPARRTDIKVSFEGVDITADMSKYLLSMTYTDNEEDEADDLQFVLQDRDGIWAERWLNTAVEGASGGRETGAEGSRYRVTAAVALNVRSGPGITYSVVGWLKHGEEIEVSTITQGWAKIPYKGGEAYVRETYIEQVSQSVSEATTGLRINASIIRRNWKGNGKDEELECGTFFLDSVDYSGPPSVVTLRATSLAYDSKIRQTEKSRSWESYTLSRIAREITGNAGMELMFLAGNDPAYQREEQYKESDIAFLKRLCHNAGLSLKCCNNALVLFSQSDFEAKHPEITIEKKKDFTQGHTPDREYTAWSMEVGTADVQYQSCRVSYNDPATGRSIEGVAKVPDYDPEKNNQQLEITAKVRSEGEAMELAAKRLRLHNKFSRTAQLDIIGNPALVAGVTVQLEKWGAWSGKYIIRRAAHTVSTDGYRTNVDLRRVLEGY